MVPFFTNCVHPSQKHSSRWKGFMVPFFTNHVRKRLLQKHSSRPKDFMVPLFAN